MTDTTFYISASILFFSVLGYVLNIVELERLKLEYLESRVEKDENYYNRENGIYGLNIVYISIMVICTVICLLHFLSK